MEKIPPIQTEFGDPERRSGGIDIKKFGSEEVVGGAEFRRREEPSPHYVLSSLNVKTAERGKGFSSQLLDEAERMSAETGTPVVLYDAMEFPFTDQNEKAKGMYGNRPGWIRLKNPNGSFTGYYVFGSEDTEFHAALLEQIKKELKIG